MKKTFITTLFAILILVSCSPKKEDLQVINNITLGQNDSLVDKEIKSLKLPFHNFYTGRVVLNQEDFIKNKGTSVHYTEILNSEFDTQENKHVGIIHRKNHSTNNLVELVVIIGHTTDVNGFTNEGYKNLTKSQYLFGNGFLPIIRVEQSKFVENLLTKKYGKPKILKDYSNINYYEKTGNNIVEAPLSEIADESSKLLKWQTKYFDVLYFTGSTSPVEYFDKSTNLYEISLHDLHPNQSYAKEYPLISYKLNDLGLEKLRIDKPNL